jgi:hypothetical protein
MTVLRSLNGEYLRAAFYGTAENRATFARASVQLRVARLCPLVQGFECDLPEPRF